MNVELTMQKIRDRSLVLREMIDRGDIILVGLCMIWLRGKLAFKARIDFLCSSSSY
jgi:hypothetical protein